MLSLLQLGTSSPKQIKVLADPTKLVLVPQCGKHTMIATPFKPDSRTGASSKQEVSSNKPEQPKTGSPNVPRLYLAVYHVSSNATKQKNLTLPLTCSTSKAYEFSLRRWRGWCSKTKINQLSATLANILSFFAECFKEGLQCRTISVLRSALSSFHPKVENFCVGQHPYVVNILRGIMNNRPPKPRDTHTRGIYM